MIFEIYNINFTSILELSKNLSYLKKKTFAKREQKHQNKMRKLENSIGKRGGIEKKFESFKPDLKLIFDTFIFEIIFSFIFS